MIQEKEFLSLCSDTVFKHLYKTKKGKNWFDNIIKKKTGLDLSEYKLYDNELNTGNKKKDYRLDLNLLKGNDAVIIEMQHNYSPYSRRKNYQYLYRTLGNMYKESEDYVDKKVKLIIFNDYKNQQIPELMVANYKLMDKENNLEIEDLESYEIYLPNFKNVCYHNANKEDVSLSLFSCKNYEEMRTRTSNKLDIEIIEELEELSMNGDIIFDYHCENDEKLEKLSLRDQALKEGREEGREQGREEGISQRNIEIAKNLLTINLSLEQISQATGLTIDEIRNIM